MPEGDTIHKLAGALERWLVGRTLRSGRLAAAPALDLASRTVEDVAARGKHLLIRLQGGTVLRSHLGLHGSWHRYAPGEPWRQPARAASIVLTTDDDVLVCFRAQEVELFDGDRPQAFELRRRLGPDLVSTTPAPAELATRARHFVAADAPVADLLLDQRVASGIGNVYKSEVLHLERVHPLTPLQGLDESSLGRLYATASRLLRANLAGGPRITRAGSGVRLWVYRRAGLPCATCGTPIASARLGRGARSTYWCPSCQPEPRPTAAPG
jgi:endonuclease-8